MMITRLLVAFLAIASGLELATPSVLAATGRDLAVPNCVIYHYKPNVSPSTIVTTLRELLVGRGYTESDTSDASATWFQSDVTFKLSSNPATLGGTLNVCTPQAPNDFWARSAKDAEGVIESNVSFVDAIAQKDPIRFVCAGSCAGEVVAVPVDYDDLMKRYFVSGAKPK